MGEARKEHARSLLYSGKAHCTKYALLFLKQCVGLKKHSQKKDNLAKLGIPQIAAIVRTALTAQSAQQQ